MFSRHVGVRAVDVVKASGDNFASGKCLWVVLWGIGVVYDSGISDLATH